MNKPVIVRPLVYEEMSEAQRQFYDPRNRYRGRLPETIHEYDPFLESDLEVEESFHRKKPP